MSNVQPTGEEVRKPAATSQSGGGGGGGGGMGSMLVAVSALALVCLGLLIVTVVLATQDKEACAPAAVAASTAAKVTVDLNFQTVGPSNNIVGANPCAGKKPKSQLPAGEKYLKGDVKAKGNPGFDNMACRFQATVQAVEQAGANVTKGYKGKKKATMAPQTNPYWTEKMCPVNVHWHLGAEHLSVGEFDEQGTGPGSKAHGRRLGAGSVREGFRCHHYNAQDKKFTTPFNWQHCVGMKVGQTYEVHWPHSAVGDCMTPHQFQSPFYDGVFCNFPSDATAAGQALSKLALLVGVQAQVFTIVNDENYYYPDLMRGMIKSGDFGKDVAMYTGSTTGTSRDNTVCSAYGPITWKVDRKCHMISASTFDKMCADMKTQNDDMSSDLYAHGARELVADDLAADNLQRS